MVLSDVFIFGNFGIGIFLYIESLSGKHRLSEGLHRFLSIFPCKSPN